LTIELIRNWLASLENGDDDEKKAINTDILVHTRDWNCS
jgi:hypothetical protein